MEEVSFCMSSAPVFALWTRGGKGQVAYDDVLRFGGVDARLGFERGGGWRLV